MMSLIRLRTRSAAFSVMVPAVCDDDSREIFGICSSPFDARDEGAALADDFRTYSLLFWNSCLFPQKFCVRDKIPIPLTLGKYARGVTSGSSRYPFDRLSTRLD